MAVLNLADSIALVKPCGIKFARHRAARTVSGLVNACMATGFPLVLKVISDKVSHKTDVGGVALNVRNLVEARRTFSRMRKIAGFKGVMVQEFIKGRQVIIGGKRDVQFGPTVLFGLGGIFVEVFKDFSIGICPLKRRDAKRMVRGVKAYELLRGVRGQKAANIRAIEDALIKASNLMCLDSRIKELDLNPLIANERGITAVDARVVV